MMATAEEHGKRPRWERRIGIAAIVVVGVVLLLPLCQEVRNGNTRIYSAVNLGYVGKALHNYAEQNGGQFPPAIVRDQEGNPLYSWRVLILPQLEEQALYDQFHLDEPWDSLHNLPLSRKRVRCYEYIGGRNNDPEGMTRYQLIRGTGAYDRDCLTLNDFTDGASKSILVVDAGVAVPWSKPVDVDYFLNQPLPRFASSYKRERKFYCFTLEPVPGFNTCFADGSVRFIDADTDERIIRGYITRNGGEDVPAFPRDR